MEDDANEVKKKIKSAYCPEKIVEGNPVLDYTKHIVFACFKEVEVKRKEEYGGNKTYTSYEELEIDYVEGLLYPGDIKSALTEYINKIIQPVRDHFKNDPEARGLLELIRSYQVTK